MVAVQKRHGRSFPTRELPVLLSAVSGLQTADGEQVSLCCEEKILLTHVHWVLFVEQLQHAKLEKSILSFQQQLRS